MATEVQLFRIKTQKHGSGVDWTRTETVQILRDTPNDANFYSVYLEKEFSRFPERSVYTRCLHHRSMRYDGTSFLPL